jgi:hypothetical protein
MAASVSTAYRVPGTVAQSAAGSSYSWTDLTKILNTTVSSGGAYCTFPGAATPEKSYIIEISDLGHDADIPSDAVIEQFNILFRSSGHGTLYLNLTSDADLDSSGTTLSFTWGQKGASITPAQSGVTNTQARDIAKDVGSTKLTMLLTGQIADSPEIMQLQTRVTYRLPGNPYTVCIGAFA